MYPPLELIHKRCTISCSQYNNPQIVVPSTCTTKDVSFNVLGQRILRRLVLWTFVRGNKRYLRRLVLWNLLFKGKGKIKRILRWLVLLLFWQREKGMKKMNNTSFWTMNFSWKRKFWTKTLWKKLRNESKICVKTSYETCWKMKRNELESSVEKRRKICLEIHAMVTYL